MHSYKASKYGHHLDPMRGEIIRKPEGVTLSSSRIDHILEKNGREGGRFRMAMGLGLGDVAVGIGHSIN